MSICFIWLCQYACVQIIGKTLAINFTHVCFSLPTSTIYTLMTLFLLQSVFFSSSFLLSRRDANALFFSPSFFFSCLCVCCCCRKISRRTNVVIDDDKGKFITRINFFFLCLYAYMNKFVWVSCSVRFFFFRNDKK